MIPSATALKWLKYGDPRFDSRRLLIVSDALCSSVISSGVNVCGRLAFRETWISVRSALNAQTTASA